MSDNSFLKDINKENENYCGKMKSLSFVVKKGSVEKKIFKWLFNPNDIDFYIAFPYFKSDFYYCGVIEVPVDPKNSEKFDAIANGNASSIPVKFSYHKDGNVHLKQSNFEALATNKWEKLAQLKAPAITDLKGGPLFSIRFEGLDKFEDLDKHSNKGGDRDTLLCVPEDIIYFEIHAYAGPSQESIENQIQKGSVPWFQLNGKSADGKNVYIGVYSILSRKTHIIDKNKNGIHVLVGFDSTATQETGRIKSLYLFAR